MHYCTHEESRGEHPIPPYRGQTELNMELSSEFMPLPKYTTYIPKRFTTDTGNEYDLRASDIQQVSKKPLFENWIPPEKTPAVKKRLEGLGFNVPDLAFNQGEVVGLSKPLNQLWEIHIRIFEGGSLQSHVEVNREYFEHLGDLRVYTAYEGYEFYRFEISEFYLKYVPNSEWITNIKENFSITLPPPTATIPWKPVVEGLAFAAIIGLATYYLTRPPGKEKNEVK